MEGNNSLETKISSNSSGHLVSVQVLPLKETLASVEKQSILNALVVTNGNKQDAAKLLEISKTSFYEKCKFYDIK
jgi:transcriptional regulator with PAS, ATPase and Fis domain